MTSTEPENLDSAPGHHRQAVGMPRQYGLRTMLVITVIYAVLFAFLASLDAPPAAFIVPAVFLAGVGLAQMFLFRGRRPREASLLGGSCLCMAGAATGVVMMHVAGERGDGVLLWIVVLTPALGAVCGYLVGAMIGAPFLVATWLRHRLGTGQQGPNGQRNVPKP